MTAALDVGLHRTYTCDLRHRTRRLLGTRVDALTRSQATATILARAVAGEAATVCACNVDMLLHGYRDKAFAALLEEADLVLPDGMPLVWLLRRLGVGGAERVAGPDLMLELCAAAAERGLPIGFYGGRPEIVARCADRLVDQLPTLKVAITLSPPFRALTCSEEQHYQEQILASGVRLLFVALGCPKQERWMQRHRDALSLPMIGVGAAIDFHAGAVSRAPLWLQCTGLEWLHRLVSEPKRLWRRYLLGNSLFLVLMAGDIARRLLPQSLADQS